MEIIYLLLPISLVFGLVALGACIVAIRRGQYEDLSGDSVRILDDDSVAKQPQSDIPQP